MRTRIKVVTVISGIVLANWYMMFGGTAPTSEEKAQQWQRDAEQGNAQAQCELGLAYSKGQGVVHDPAESVKWLRKSAEQGNAEAQENLGQACLKEGTPHSIEEGIKWFRKSAEQGNAAGQVSLGFGYIIGLGGDLNEAEAIALFRKAANQRDSSGFGALGWVYECGLGVTKDNQVSYGWYLLASRGGVTNYLGKLSTLEQLLSQEQQSQAQTWAEHWKPDVDQSMQNENIASPSITSGASCENSTGSVPATSVVEPRPDPTHPSKPINYTHLTVSKLEELATNDNAEALLELANRYSRGRDGAQKNMSQAIGNLAKSAKLGNPNAAYQLARAYYYGSTNAVIHVNVPQAKLFYQKAYDGFTTRAESGDPEAALSLVRFDHKGLDEIGLLHNDEYEAKWMQIAISSYKQLAEGGNIDAAYWLAIYFSDAHNDLQGVVNIPFATQWFKVAIAGLKQRSEAGDTDSMLELVWACKHAKYGPHDSAESYHWAQEAARRHASKAYLLIGDIYSVGDESLHISKDFDKAVEQYKEAIPYALLEGDNRLAEAYARLGDIYRRRGVVDWSVGLTEEEVRKAYRERHEAFDEDLREALKWYQASAKLGNYEGKIGAEGLLKMLNTREKTVTSQDRIAQPQQATFVAPVIAEMQSSPVVAKSPSGLPKNIIMKYSRWGGILFATVGIVSGIALGWVLNLYICSSRERVSVGLAVTLSAILWVTGIVALPNIPIARQFFSGDYLVELAIKEQQSLYPLFVPAPMIPDRMRTESQCRNFVAASVFGFFFGIKGRRKKPFSD